MCPLIVKSCFQMEKKIKRMIVNRSFTLIVVIVFSNIIMKFRNVYGLDVIREIVKTMKCI